MGEKKNCGNQVAEILGRNLKKKKNLWLICGNATDEIKGKKIVAIDLWNGIAEIKGKKKW